MRNSWLRQPNPFLNIPGAKARSACNSLPCCFCIRLIVLQSQQNSAPGGVGNRV